MPDIIRDGAGKGYLCKVNRNNQLEVRTEGVDSSSIVAERDELYFNWQSDYSATANDFVMYIKNTASDKNLKIRKCYMYNSVAATWEFHKVDSGTISGTTITGVNLTFGSNISAEATAYGDAAVSGISTSTMMWSYTKSAAGDDHYLDANGAVILKPNSAIAVKTSASGTIKVYIAGYYTNTV